MLAQQLLMALLSFGQALEPLGMLTLHLKHFCLDGLNSCKRLCLLTLDIHQLPYQLWQRKQLLPQKHCP